MYIFFLPSKRAKTKLEITVVNKVKKKEQKRTSICRNQLKAKNSEGKKKNKQKEI